jgi:hypothetical protein
MTERNKELLWLAALLAVLILFFSKILFTGQIIRAPDITNEFIWNVKHFREMGFLDLFRLNLNAGWDMFANGGGSEGGGTLSMQFLLYRSLLFWLIPSPANIAWFIVLHLFFGAAGVWFCCRAVGASRFAAFLGGLIFALAPEIASLINAGHVQKIATISFAPWAFYFLERGFQTRRFIYPLTVGVVLAFQFFNMHWQIAYYTCLCVGAYGVFRSIGILVEEHRAGGRAVARLIGLNAVVLLFFLSTVAISLVPVATWSKDTTRGAATGANQGKGGLNVEEAMSWSLPPEELATMVIPGLVGFSRQEGAGNSADIKAYYWGRMAFTQTTDYMGLLPWLLLPLPLIFRRDRYTWLALGGIVGGLLFSMGRFTPFYWLLYEHFPGVSNFRVPKMMMIIPVLGLALLAARGLDCLLDEELRRTKGFRRWTAGILGLPLLLLGLLALEYAARDFWVNALYPLLAEPTRFEQGPQLIAQRWNNLVRETGIAVFVAAAHALVLFSYLRGWVGARAVPYLLALLYLADVGRVDAKYMLLQPPPPAVKGERPAPLDFLGTMSKEYRILPMNGTDPMLYASQGVPVMFTSNPVQMQRWQEFLDGFSLTSSMPDMMNVKYLIYGGQQYQEEKSQLGGKYVPVYTVPGSGEVILENRTVLPKAWLVPSALVIDNPNQEIAIIQSPAFDPRHVAVVESPPPVPLPAPELQTPAAQGTVRLTRYEANRIDVSASTDRNALLVLGDKYAIGWRATVDGAPVEIVPVNRVLRGVYLAPGSHTIVFEFDPLPFKVGKYLTLCSFAFFAAALLWELVRSRRQTGTAAGA